MSGVAGYREIAPPPVLASQVLQFWTSAIPIGRDPAAAPIIPDGCVDIIWVDAMPPIVVGPMTTAALPWPLPGSVVTGVRFRPGMGAAVLRERCDELVDREAPLAAIWGDGAVRDIEYMLDGVPPDGRVAAVAAALLDRGIETTAGDPVVLGALDWLRQHPARPVARLVDELGLSERQLRRRVVEAVGYGPKTFQRVMRVQRSLAGMRAAPTDTIELATLASEAGFADQAHMTREFRRLTGMTPGAALSTGVVAERVTGWPE